MRKPTISARLLDLTCAPITQSAAWVGDLSDDERLELRERAAQHRLEPMLYDRFATNDAIPQAIRDAWRDAYRFWAMRTAAAAVDLRETFALLRAEGFAPLALKGAFLAWHAYPRPALRPLRDIDVLVPEDRAMDAFALLRERGWTRSSMAAATGGKHLPPLIARCGTTIELHHRLWERDGELDHRSPIADHDAMWARSITVDGITYPCTNDMLAHLVVHAVYSHRFDCGPLLLWDIYWLARCWPIDWPALHARAVRERWEHGLDLTIALCRRHLGDDAIALGSTRTRTLPDGLVEAAADLMLQDLATRRSAGLAATAMVHGVGAVAARVGRGASIRLEKVPCDAAVESLGAWTKARLRRTVTDLADRAVRGQASDLSRLSKWLGT